MGVIKNDSVEAHGDNFECPSHLFQTLLNSICAPSEYQLSFVRAYLRCIQPARTQRVNLFYIASTREMSASTVIVMQSRWFSDSTATLGCTCRWAPLDNLSVTPCKLTHKWHPTAIWVRKTSRELGVHSQICFQAVTRVHAQIQQGTQVSAHFVAPSWGITHLSRQRDQECCGKTKPSVLLFSRHASGVCRVQEQQGWRSAQLQKVLQEKNKEWTEKGRPMKYTTKFCEV